MANLTDLRTPAVAGSFYPADAGALREILGSCLTQGREMLEGTPLPQKVPKALVVPHAGYIYSGPVAACAFLQVPDWSRISRIHIWGPAHTRSFPGVAGGTWKFWETPLGRVTVDEKALREMEARGLITLLDEAHREEHSLEVQIPFLQFLGFRGPVVPLVFGSCDPSALLPAMEDFLEPQDLLLVSTDLSHFHSRDRAEALDSALLEKVLEGDAEALRSGEACGRLPLEALVQLANRRAWVPRLLWYRTSGEVSGDLRRVVGYGALCYREDSHG